MNGFGYLGPATLQEAAEAYAAHPGARYLAGGTNPVDLVKLGVERPAFLVDVGRLPLDGIGELVEHGDPEGAFAAAQTRVDVAHRVSPLHNHPMEPHATTAYWDDDRLTVYTSSQGGTTARSVLAQMFELPEDHVTAVSEHVGGGFGAKGTPRPGLVLAAMAALRTARPVTLAHPVLAQIAADTLGTGLDRVRIEIGHSDLPPARLAGGSTGTASWGWAVHDACADLAARVAAHCGPLPAEGIDAHADTAGKADTEVPYARHAFGAHFAEAAVDTVTGETRVRRLLGVFAAGHILNSRTARSQFTGALIMGLGMALTEGSTLDPAFGDFTECGRASYHVPANADVPAVEAHWIEEDDTHLNPMGAKGIGEIGIVATAAAIGNAVHHATGVRCRELPLTPDRILAGLPAAR
ncbi:molybdopterin cofactor-binding domain-containing protein [Streptomyces sp. NPDC001034]|uniref:molybdopterin cofactor-binding domain-containing protein n=1 Tax=Streptomyces sp. NPDC001034 TaxID=3154375 RepID=UPI003333689C